MDRYYQILFVSCLVFEAFVLFLALWKKKITLCYSFFAYLVITFLSDLAAATLKLSPEFSRQLYRWDELVANFVKIILVLELNFRVFKYYPRVRRSNQFIFFFAGIFFFVYHLLTPQIRGDWWFSRESDLNSKILQATCVVLLFMSGSILFYRLHIPSAYKYLLLGFLTSQFALALGLAILATFGQRARVPVTYSNAIFFLIALIIWTRGYLTDG
jgi:hypothetical protein